MARRFLRLTHLIASRNLAQSLAESGHLRIDARAVIKPATTVCVGNVLTFAAPSGDIRVVRIEALPQRRGPSNEARTFYSDVPMRMIDGTTEQN